VKVPIAQEKCPHCGLIYERLRLTTNKSAKLALKRGHKHKVINYAVLPPDINWLRLFLYCIFFGYVGIHRFYVGKIKSGFFFLFSFLAVFIASLIFTLQAETLYNLAYFMTMPIAFNALFWVMDIFSILFKKFKVPVSIPEDFAVDGEYGGVLDLVRDIDNSVDINKRKKIREQARKEALNDTQTKDLKNQVLERSNEISSLEETQAEPQSEEEEPQKKVVVFDQRTINKGSKSKKKKHKKGRK
jgi:TM2 domain-containing membrane protein YozV